MLQLSLQPLALDRDLPEGFPEKVLGAVATPVTPVAAYRDDYALVLAVVREQTFEAVCESHEVFVFSDLCFQ